MISSPSFEHRTDSQCMPCHSEGDILTCITIQDLSAAKPLASFLGQTSKRGNEYQVYFCSLKFPLVFPGHLGFTALEARTHTPQLRIEC
jgi:hypothetical protein